MRAVTAAVVLSCGLAASAFAQQAPPAAVPVGTVPAERRPVARTADFVGRVQAINRVDIQARVTGFLDQVLFWNAPDWSKSSPSFRRTATRHAPTQPWRAIRR